MSAAIKDISDWLSQHQALLFSYIVNMAVAIVILAIGIFLSRFLSRSLNRILRLHVDAAIAGFLSSIVRYGVIVLTLITALERVGVQTTSVIAVLGAAGLAVGLALQGSLSNLAAGVLLVVIRPFRAGEHVDLGGGIAGVVSNMQIFSTTLLTGDGKTVVVPNSKIISNNIINFSREPLRRNEFIIGVSYDADVDKVIKILRDVIEAEPRVSKDRPVQIGLNEMAASSLNFIVRCWSGVGDLQSVYWDLMAAFKRALDANKIGIPYPQMDVHLYKSQEGSGQATEKS